MSRVASIRLLTAAFLVVCFISPGRVAAGGLEYTAAGATALGRGGAVTARADDPMVLSYNPAGLVELRGSQLLLDVNIATMSACVDPYGYYGWGVYGGGHPSSIPDAATGARNNIPLGTPPASASANAYYNDPLDTVCMNQHVAPVPQLLVTSRLSDKLGIGGGLAFPAMSPTGQWGDSNGVIHGKTGELRPAATRYMLMNAGNLGIFPTFGLAYRVTPWLRVGGAFEWGMVWVDSTQMAGVGPGTSPDNDVIAHIKGHDYFIPGFTGSVHVVPNDNLDVVAAFRYQDSLDATGNLDLTTGVFGADTVAHTTRHLNVLSIKQNMPWKLRGGVRYSSRLAPRPTGTGAGDANAFPSKRVHDAMEDERWDVEVDAEYQINSRNQAQTISYQPNQLVAFQGKPMGNMPGAVTTAAFPDFTAVTTTIDKRWKDQISLRVGSTYNVLPGLFSVMGGVHYENRGVDPAYMQIDFWPVQRIGLHGGVTFRLFGTTDLVVSYAHIFDETMVVAAPSHLDATTIYNNTPIGQAPTNIDKSVGIAGRGTLPPLEELNKPTAPDGVARVKQVTTKSPAGQPPYIINSGIYRSSMNVVAIGVHGHF